ncbi:MAG: purine-nucleoside phosphorylase [Bacillota bacterium]|nr:purine-nucleoside phosphorylase [Bacillota bacterium]
MEQKIKESSRFIQDQVKEVPEVAIVLGTGLGDFGSSIEERVVIPYEEIPHFPVSTVEGHAGCLLFGKLAGKYVIAMQGRFHYYEGYDMAQVTFPIRVFYELGCRKLVLTNAVGGVNVDFRPGQLMLIEDHINFGGISPLRGKNLDDYGPRFPDVSDVYSKEFNGRILAEAQNMGMHPAKGVYCYMPGPQFETAAEIRMARILGADVVGMSTVPEAIVAAHMGMRVTGISCVTNMGTGVLDGPIDHAGVNEVAKSAEGDFGALLRKIVELS